MINVENMKSKNRLVMGILVSIFIIYNVFVYTQGTTNITPKMSESALRGEKLYQENNCTACHQLYGLGGYLGPDLTNTVSTKPGGEMYVKAFLNSGIKAMPKFEFTEEEMNDLVQFFKEVDNTGHYPDFESHTTAAGWVELKYKNQ